MFVVPFHAAAGAMAAAKEDRRFAVSGVEIVHDTAAGTYSVSSTDCHKLVRVEGRLMSVDPVDVPGELVTAPNGCRKAVVPAKWFTQTANAVRKVADRKQNKRTAGLMVATGDATTTVGGQLWGEVVKDQAENLDGRFPPVAEMLARHERDEGTTVRLDPTLVKQLMAAAEVFHGEDAGWVELTVPRCGTRPVRVETKKGDERFRGLVMPLAR